MKYLKQFGILAGITCVGEILHFFIPLPIPGSVYGLLLLLVLLMTGALKVGQVKEAAEFLIEIMPVLFIPAAAGLVVTWSALSRMLLPVCVMIVVSTFLVMVVTGKTAEAMLRRTGKSQVGNSQTGNSQTGNRSAGNGNMGCSRPGAEEQGGAGHAE